MSTNDSLSPPGVSIRHERESATDFACRICRNEIGNERFEVREMMLGLRESFSYVECEDCGTIQIDETPHNLERYYPDDYYSKNIVRQTPAVRMLKRIRAETTLGQKTLLGRALVRLLGPSPAAIWMRDAATDREVRILDVGSGNGQLLLELGNMGYSNLTGVDPFIDGDLLLDFGIRIRKASIHEIEEEYELIMFHHVLEHVPDPHTELSAARSRLSPGGRILVRTPVAGCYAWRHYGSHWVQLDAPRHVHILSERAMRMMAARHGLRVISVRYDSDAFQFWGSEQYLGDIALADPSSFQYGSRTSAFSRSQIRSFARQAEALNLAEDGDQAIYVLSPADHPLE